MAPGSKAVEISFPLPKAPHVTLHGHLWFDTGYTMVHLTTSDIGEASGSQAPLGSFVYAMPNLRNERDILNTILVSSGSSIEYATRLGNIIARKTKVPTYVSCSMNFAGITPEEEMEGFRKIVEEIMARFHECKNNDSH